MAKRETGEKYTFHRYKRMYAGLEDLSIVNAAQDYLRTFDGKSFSRKEFRKIIKDFSGYLQKQKVPETIEDRKLHMERTDFRGYKVFAHVAGRSLELGLLGDTIETAADRTCEEEEKLLKRIQAGENRLKTRTLF